MNKRRISIHVCTKDRHSEIAILLQSLRTQTIQDWDLILIDDASGTPLNTHHPSMTLVNRLKNEGHKIKIIRNHKSYGVCNARNRCIEEDTFDNEYVLRLDDDCVPEGDYFEKLLEVIDKGYDMATGLIPLIAYPELVRESKRVGQRICLHEINKEGELITRKDELAYAYDDKDLILPCHQFRTNCLYKKEITDKGVRYPDTLSKIGFREELWFSFRAQIKGYSIGAHLGAVAYHFQTPSGGCRAPDYSECVQLDEQTTNKWVKKMYKEHGDFLK